MESFGSHNKNGGTTFGLIRRGNAADMKKMKPHFFRVMLDFMLQDSKIYIPTEFVKKYRSRLVGSSATLKVANGDTWEVELVTDDDGLIWLVKGWEDFTNHHSLKQGDIVVFRLEQDSLFRVVVFEPTTSEKKYLCKDANRLKRLFDEVKVEEETVRAGKLEEVKTKKSGGEEKSKVKLAAPVETPNHPLETKMSGRPKPRRDNASTSSKNPSFSITIREYNMKRSFGEVPRGFVFNHMRPESGTVKVSAEDGSGSWALSFIFSERPGHNHGRGFFAGGWRAFRRDNSQKIGDVCRFELISTGLMKVTIERH